MRRSLVVHPDFHCDAVSRIDVAVKRSGRMHVLLEYRVEGAIADLRLPAPSAPTRSDELWQHTCFEAFIRTGNDDPYFEFNFAPSTQWAAYRFDAYRAGMSPAPGINPPGISVKADTSSFVLLATLALDGLTDFPGDGPLRLGLSAVIEETSGRKSWWALAHPPGRPDFHHRDCFALELPRI
jgi:hypothetical protein